MIHGSFHPPEIMWRKKKGKYVQIGVDWEASRVGVPEEDFQVVVGQLLSASNITASEVMIKEYWKEMDSHGINFNYDIFYKSVKKFAYFQVIGSELPFVIGQYLQYENDLKFQQWLKWAKSVIPGLLDFSLDGLIKYCT